VCYQGFPDELLLEVLQHDTPCGIWYLTDGELSKARSTIDVTVMQKEP
jgi:alpha-ketoglutaric semialdehyde dehydrogenase